MSISVPGVTHLSSIIAHWRQAGDRPRCRPHAWLHCAAVPFKQSFSFCLPTACCATEPWIVFCAGGWLNLVPPWHQPHQLIVGPWVPLCPAVWCLPPAAGGTEQVDLSFPEVRFDPSSQPCQRLISSAPGCSLMVGESRQLEVISWLKAVWC